MTSFVDALYSRFADPKYSECNSCELFIIGSLSPGKSGKTFSSSISPSSSIRDICYAYSWYNLNGETTFAPSRCPLSSLHGMNFIVTCIPILWSVRTSLRVDWVSLKWKAQNWSRDLLTRLTLSHFHLLLTTNTFNCYIVRLWYLLQFHVEEIGLLRHYYDDLFIWFEEFFDLFIIETSELWCSYIMDKWSLLPFSPFQFWICKIAIRFPFSLFKSWFWNPTIPFYTIINDENVFW